MKIDISESNGRKETKANNNKGSIKNSAIKSVWHVRGSITLNC